MALDDRVLEALTADSNGMTAEEVSNVLKLRGNGQDLFNTFMRLKHEGRVTRTRVNRNGNLVAGWRLPQSGDVPGQEERSTQGGDA